MSATWKGPAAAVLLTAALLGAVAALPLPGACARPATASAGAAHATSTAPPAGRRIQGSDWLVAMWRIAQLRAAPPSEPVVYLLGGSSARECTVGDEEWAQEIADLGGPEVLAVNLGTRNQTFGQDLGIVKALPVDVPSLVFIGVAQSRFTMGAMDASVVLPDPESARPAGSQHHYSAGTIKALSAKRALVTSWMKKRYPVFRARYKANLAALEKVVQACRRRGFHPVLVDLPRLTSVIGHAWDAPIRMYHKGCWQLKAEYDVPYVNFVGACGFVQRDFYDLVHLVDPGRPKYQRGLSTQAVRLLAKYDMGPAGDE